MNKLICSSRSHPLPLQPPSLPALRRLAGKRMRKLLRHEIKSNLQLATSERLAYLSLQTAGRAVVGAAAAVAILHIQVLVKCSAAKAPTDIQQMHVRNKENSSLFQARRLSNRAMSMSMSMRGLPIPRCVCVCVHREGTCSVPQKRRTTNRARQTSRGHR